jgi:predicted TIM-barrel fold metal-dependent hydrolase
MSDSEPRIIVDAVIHAYNLEEDNVLNDVADGIRRVTNDVRYLTGDTDDIVSRELYNRNWQIDELADLVFTESEVQVGVYHGVPWKDYFRDGMVSNEKGAEMVQRWPNRVYFYGTLDPLKEKDPVAEVDRLVNELGACGIKLYPESYTYADRDAQSVERIDLGDERLRPMMERIVEMDVPVAIHKAVPGGHGLFDHYRQDDLERAALAYPDLKIEVVHSGMAFIEETASLMARYENVWANLEVTTAYAPRARHRFAQALAGLMVSGASDRIISASGACLVHPQPVIEAIREVKLPDDVMEETGLPQIDAATIDGLLGLNWARMHDLDIAATLAAIEGDEFEQRKADGLRPRWSSIGAVAAA